MLKIDHVSTSKIFKYLRFYLQIDNIKSIEIKS